MTQQHNERSAEMWKIIKSNYAFKDKTVVDLGCGKGDLCAAALRAGARRAICVDNKQTELDIARRNCRSYAGSVRLLKLDLNDPFEVITTLWHYIPEDKIGGPLIDVGFFTSVMPYLDKPEEALHAYMGAFKVMFIEAQYKGDGPGIVAGNLAMHKLLTIRRNNSVEYIGSTLVRGRCTHRAIWKFTNREA